jgi:hypothetical protein
MKARYPSSRDCFDCRGKSNEVKNTVTEATTSNELMPNSVSTGAMGCCIGIQDDKTKQTQ